MMMQPGNQGPGSFLVLHGRVPEVLSRETLLSPAFWKGVMKSRYGGAVTSLTDHGHLNKLHETSR